MTSSTTSAVTEEIVASLGLPEVIVSEMLQILQVMSFWCEAYVRTPPYHPASNGLAERAVQTFKGMRKLKEGSLETKLSRFLFKYRITPPSIPHGFHPLN